LKWKNIDFKLEIIYTGITKIGERLIKKMNSKVEKPFIHVKKSKYNIEKLA